MRSSQVGSGRPRPLASFCALLAMLAMPSFAESFGPINVNVLSSLGDGANSGFNMHRFEIENPSADSHQVSLTIVARGYGVRSELHAARTFNVAPRSTLSVEVPEPLAGWAPARELDVTVDGRGRPPQLKLTSQVNDERATQILLAPSVPDVRFREEAKKRGVVYDFVRTEILPRQWSTSWLAYSPYSGLVMTPADWSELPAPARVAVQRWVRSGGTLLIAGGGIAVPDARITERGEDYIAANVGFGKLFCLTRRVEDAGNAIFDLLQRAWMRSTEMMSTQNAPMDTMPLLAGRHVPVTGMFALLVVFAIVGGPVSLFVHARRDRRLWIFWTLPLLAVISGAGIVLASLASEGWQRVVKSASLTWLDENSGEATTLGVTGFYATLPPNGQIRFSSDTEFRPYGGAVHVLEVDETDGQRLSGWVDSRVSSYFAVRKCEHRRERLPIRLRDGRYVALNGLGARIECLWFAADDGAIYRASRIEPGAEGTLERTELKVGDRVDNSLGGPDAWPTFPERLRTDPRSLLQRGMYIANVASSPFVDAALERPTTNTAPAAVIGVMKRGDDAR